MHFCVAALVYTKVRILTGKEILFINFILLLNKNMNKKNHCFICIVFTLQ